MKHLRTAPMSFSRNSRNRNRNLRRLFREIHYTEQCTALSSAERERKLDRLRLELEGFQRGKQYASSAVHHPDQFEDKPILDEKTYAKFKDRIKHIVRQLSAGAEGAKDERDELHREVAELKGLVLTRRMRAKLNREMCLTPRSTGGVQTKCAPSTVKDRGGRKKRLVKQKLNQSSESEVPNQSSESEVPWCSTSKFTRRRSPGDRLPSKVCNSGRASKTGNQRYNVGTGRGQRRFRSADSRTCRKHRKLFSKFSEQAKAEHPTQ